MLIYLAIAMFAFSAGFLTGAVVASSRHRDDAMAELLDRRGPPADRGA